jgi:hypothetical protein
MTRVRRCDGAGVRGLVRALTIALILGAVPAMAQNQAAPVVEDDPDKDPNPSQPDFTIINLPTTLRLPRFSSAFRVTHRFGRPLGAGDFGDLAGDLFGLDAGGQIGLEYRFGLASGLQAGIFRTSNKTIEFFGQYNVVQQGDTAPIGFDVVARYAGTNNFRNVYTPSLGVVISRELGRHGAVYLEPIWVHNSNPLDLPGDDNDSFLIGFGTRLRIRPTVYLVGEFSPRVGYDTPTHHASFGIEKRAGGHNFQLNFSNGLSSTLADITSFGGTDYDDWYLGFNISRKFF